MKNQTKNYKFRKTTKPSYNTPKFSHHTHNENESSGNIGDNAYKHAVKCRDKYLMLAKEAYAAGDRVAAESFYQHADHYERTIMESKSQRPVVTPPPIQVAVSEVVSDVSQPIEENLNQEEHVPPRKPRFRKQYTTKPAE